MVFPFRRKKFKIDCQDSCCGGHLGFPTRTILAIFDLQVTQILRIKLQVRWHFGSGNEVQNRISRWRPYLIFNQKYFSYFQYEIILASEFQSQNLASRIKREIQYRFSRWRLSQPSWIFDRNDFSCFWSTHCPNTCYQVLSQLAYLFSRRNSKYIFKIRMIKSQGRRLQTCSPFFFFCRRYRRRSK